MQLTKKVLLSLIITGALFIGFLVGLEYFKNADRAMAGVNIGNEHQATSTDSTWSSKECKPVLVDNKTLGSVVVTLTSNAPLYIYDATTTVATQRTNTATTTIAAFKTTTAGSYVFEDVRLQYGLCVVAGESTVGIASTTITSRP